MENQNKEMNNHSNQTKEYHVLWTEGINSIKRFITMEFPLTFSLHDVYESLREKGFPLPNFATFQHDNRQFPNFPNIYVNSEFKDNSSSSISSKS